MILTKSSGRTMVLRLVVMTCAIMAMLSGNVSADLVWGDFTYTINSGTATITDYTGAGGAVTIPPSIPPGGATVTSIGYQAFDGCTALTSVSIPSGVLTIGSYAFEACTHLTGVTIPSSVTSIGSSAFSGCISLGTVTISDGAMTGIGSDAFYGCTHLTTVTIGNGVTSIGDLAFYGCTSLTVVTIGSSVTSIGYEAFDGCTNLRGVYFQGNAPTSIGSYAFSGDSHATIYYLPWTTGWPPVPGLWAGCPTALWTVFTVNVTPSTTTSYGTLLVLNHVDRTFTVQNVSTFTISGTASVSSPSPFSVLSGGSYTLAPQASQMVTVRYAPTVAGNDMAYVTFTGAGNQIRQVTGSAYSDPTTMTGTITGRVTRVSDGSPVSGVTISVIGPGAGNGRQSPQAVTGVNGGYSMSGLRSNAHYSVTANPPTPLLNVGTTNEVTVVVGQTTIVNIALSSITQPPSPTPQNTPVVLVRGYGSDTEWAVEDSNSWHEIHSALVASGFTNVWDCNQPETGILNSQGTMGHFINGTLSIEANAASLISYVQQKAEKYRTTFTYYPPQIHIVAHSMGGLFTRGALGNYDHIPLANPSFTLKVGKVVMLGTPNCGSKVADYGFQVGGGGLLMDILHMHWASTTNLQTSEMTGHYNPSHPWPSVPLYLFSAGNSAYVIGKGLSWNGQPDPCPLGGVAIGDMNVWDNVWETDERINDGLVTKPSVNGTFWAWGSQWPWLHSVKSVKFSPVQTSGACNTPNPVQSITDADLGKSLDHFFLMKDSAVVSWITNTLLNPASTPTSIQTTTLAGTTSAKTLVAAEATQQSTPMQPFESLAGTVTKGAVLALPVTSDAGTTLTVQLMASDTNIIFRLNDPFGTRIDANTPQTNTSVQYTASVMASNLLQANFTIANPTAGIWTAVIDASNITTAQAAYDLMAFGDSNVGLLPQTMNLFAPGQDAVLSCVLADITTNPFVAVSNASVTSIIRLPDGTTNSLALFDDGWHNDCAPNDGVYAGVLPKVQQVGRYSIAYRASGTTALGQPLQRVATGTFSVSSGNGSVLGDPIYATVDTDGDGIADFIEVKCWVNPTVSGNYILAGDLVDVGGTCRFSQSAAFCADGTGPIMATLIFSLAEIRAASAQGTYHMENLQLFEVTSTGTAWLNAYQGSSVVNIQAAKAINVSPSNLAANVSRTAGLLWTDGGGASNYDVYFGTNAVSLSFKTNQTGTTYDPGTLACNTAYFWQINARNTAGVTTGDVWTFTTLAQYSLTVTMPAYGKGNPPGGSQLYDYGTNITASVTNSPIAMGATTQYVCSGWTGTGSVLSNPTGGTNTGAFNLTNNSAIIWLWATNYLLTVATNGNGSLNTPGGWWPRGSSAQITATPAGHSHLSGWSGQTNGCTIAGNVITAPMTMPRVITANFTVNKPPTLSVTPGSLDFGSVQINTVANLAFMVQNVGDEALTGCVSGLTAPFAFLTSPNYALAAGASTNLIVCFAPTAGGITSNSAVFNSNGGALTRAVTGTAGLLNLLLPANGGVLQSFSSQYDGSTYAAAKLTDGAVGTWWCSAANPGPQSFVYSFLSGQVARLGQVVLYGTSDGYSSKTFDIQVSLDGINYYTALTNGTLVAGTAAQPFDLGGVLAKRVRLTIKSGVVATYWELSEFQAWGYFVAVAPQCTIRRLGTSPTNASTLGFGIDFTAPVTGFTQSDISLASGGTAAGNFANFVGSGSSYTVQVVNVTGDGTLGISVPAGVCTDSGGRSNEAAAAMSYVVDHTAPVPGTASVPATAQGVPIAVSYAGAGDSGSGLKKVELWYRKGTGGAWTDSGLTLTNGSDAFSFTTVTGDDTYSFDLVAEDWAGNRSAPASGNGDCATVFSTPPASVNLLLPAYGGVLQSFSSQYSAGYAAANLADGSVGTLWCSTVNPGPQSFVYSFQSGLVARLGQVVLYGTSDGYSSKTFDIQVSLDGTTYTVATTGTLVAGTAAQPFDLGGVLAKRVKLTIKSGVVTSYWELSEFQAWGYLLGLQAPFRITGRQLQPSTNAFRISWDCATGSIYRIWWTDDLKAGWPTNQTRTNAVGCWDDPATIPGPSRYYRVSVEP